MGIRYVVFRAYYELSRKLGLLNSKYPVNPEFVSYTSLSEWKNLDVKFFFDSKEDLCISKNPHDKLKSSYEKMMNGCFPFFNSMEFKVEKIDWLTNVSTD